MASHMRDDVMYGEDHPDTHASANRWRHQESASFARHAAPREAAAEKGGSKDLTDFLNTTRVEPPESAGSGGKSVPLMVAGNVHHGPAGSEATGMQQAGSSSG